MLIPVGLAGPPRGTSSEGVERVEVREGRDRLETTESLETELDVDEGVVRVLDRVVVGVLVVVGVVVVVGSSSGVVVGSGAQVGLGLSTVWVSVSLGRGRRVGVVRVGTGSSVGVAMGGSNASVVGSPKFHQENGASNCRASRASAILWGDSSHRRREARAGRPGRLDEQEHERRKE